MQLRPYAHVFLEGSDILAAVRGEGNIPFGLSGKSFLGFQFPAGVEYNFHEVAGGLYYKVIRNLLSRPGRFTESDQAGCFLAGRHFSSHSRLSIVKEIPHKPAPASRIRPSPSGLSEYRNNGSLLVFLLYHMVSYFFTVS